VLTVILSHAAAAGEVLLKSPGLRPVKAPLVVIPSDRHYPNQPPDLPNYRNASGKPAEGWASKYIETRRFSSDQSAMIYYRFSDLARANVIGTLKSPTALQIWPVGSILVLESYQGSLKSTNGAKLLEIEAMKKTDNHKDGLTNSFFPVNWSYARFSPKGTLSITSQKINECHQCHSIAFQITGDLIFTLFP